MKRENQENDRRVQNQVKKKNLSQERSQEAARMSLVGTITKNVKILVIDMTETVIITGGGDLTQETDSDLTPETDTSDGGGLLIREIDKGSDLTQETVVGGVRTRGTASVKGSLLKTSSNSALI